MGKNETDILVVVKIVGKDGCLKKTSNIPIYKAFDGLKIVQTR